MHFWPKFGNTDFNLWWLIARTSSKWGKFWLLSSIWFWSSRSIIPKNNRDLNQGLLHLWSKFGDSSLNGWWVTARTSWWLTDRHTHTHTHTHAGNDNTRRPKLASGNYLSHVESLCPNANTCTRPQCILFHLVITKILSAEPFKILNRITQQTLIMFQ